MTEKNLVYDSGFVALHRPDPVVLELNIDHGKANTLSVEAMKQVRGAIPIILEDEESKVVLLYGRSAGAHLSEIYEVETYEDALDYAMFGQDIISAFESVPGKIIVGAVPIPGYALGGGCEFFMLPADYRFVACQASLDKDADEFPYCHAKVGLPEATLKIRPGWGGRVRFLEIVQGTIGQKAALSYIEAGTTFEKCKGWQRGECEAFDIGLIDGFFSKNDFYSRVLDICRNLVYLNSVKENDRYRARQIRITAADRCDRFKEEREDFARRAITPEAKEAMSPFVKKGGK